MKALKTTGLIAFSMIPCALAAQKNAKSTQNASLEKSRPNIIFIFADDWGYGDLSCHGHTGLRTPNIDRMAAEGIDFRQFNVCSPVSSSSRTAVMTGNFPSRHRVHEHFADAQLNEKRDMPNWLDPSVTMLPRLLREAGYKTAHYGKWHLTSSSSTATAPVPAEYGYDDTKVYNGGGPQLSRKRTPGMEHVMAYFTQDAVDCTMDFIRRNRQQPFFVNLWIHESHQRIVPLPEMREAYKDVQEPQQTYYAAISGADANIGRLMDFLREQGLDGNTLVIFSSDNGPEHNNSENTRTSVGETGGLKGRKRSIYEGGVKVPFIVRFPGKVPAGAVDTTTLLAAVDLLPTFCALAGAELPEGYEPDGENICKAITGKPFSRTKPIYQYWNGNASSDNWARLAVTDGRWKLLTDFDGSRTELYDHLPDWGETNNLADKYPAETQRLRRMAMNYYESLPLNTRQ